MRSGNWCGPYDARAMRPRHLIPAALLVMFALPASALGASAPTLSLINVPVGVIVGHPSPYTENTSTVQMSIGYSGHLAKGSKLVLLVKPSGSSYKASKTKITLHGGHAKISVKQGGLGGPFKYKVAVMSGSRTLSVSKPVPLYWAPPPAGVFVLGEESAYTSRIHPSESCEGAGKCKGDGASEENDLVRAAAGNTPMPAGWTVTLLYNGQQVCTTKDINGECSAPIQYPKVTAATEVTETAELTSPTGVVTSATLTLTIFP
jgi:hypothetical protein